MDRVPKFVTFDRVLLALVLAAQLGGQVQGQLHNNVDQSAQIASLEVRLTAAEQTYVRRDVLEERLKAIEAIVADIKVALKRP